MSITTLTLAKSMLQVRHSEQDDLIQALLDGAEAFLAAHLGVVFGAADVVENLPVSSKATDFRTLSAFNRPAGDDYLVPSTRPVNAVTSVLDTFNANAVQTFVKIRNLIAWSSGGIRYGAWPQGEQRYEVHYNGGVALVAGKLPAALQLCVLQLVSRIYSARSGEIASGSGDTAVQFGSLMSSDLEMMVREFSQKRVVTI